MLQQDNGGCREARGGESREARAAARVSLIDQKPCDEEAGKATRISTCVRFSRPA